MFGVALDDVTAICAHLFLAQPGLVLDGCRAPEVTRLMGVNGGSDHGLFLQYVVDSVASFSSFFLWR